MPAEFPSLAASIQIAPYDGGGEKRFLVLAPQRRQWIVPAGLAGFLQLLDGTRSIAQLQDEIDGKDYPGVTGCRVEDVLGSLAMRGILSGELRKVSAEGASRRRNPMFFSIPLMESRFLSPALRVFAPLFTRVGMGLVAALGIAVQIISWYALNREWHGGFAPSVRPLEWVLIALAVLLCGPWHELGHLAACERFHCGAGRLGLGVYWLFPVMWIDLSASVTLPWRQRFVINIGGMYFQYLAALVMGIVHLVTHDVVWGVLALLYMVLIIGDLNPLLKFDGYWCISDALGTPNLHREARSALFAFLQRGMGWKADDSVMCVSGWKAAFLTVFGALHLLFVAWIVLLMIGIAPRVFTWLSLSHWILFLRTLHANPFSASWWEHSQAQVGQLLISLTWCVMAAGSLGRALVMCLQTFKKKGSGVIRSVRPIAEEGTI